MATYSNRTVVMVFAVIIALLIGVVVGFALDPEDAADDPDAAPVTPSGPGPTREVGGVPVGYARTEDGAVAAATNFTLLTTRDALIEEEALTRALQTLAAPSWRDNARAQAKAGTEFLVDRYGSDAQVAGAVVRYDVAKFTADTAVVDLWAVSVAAGSRRSTVDEIWSILRVDLAWVEGDWRVTASDSKQGPAPVDLPTRAPSRTAQDVMEQFAEFEGPVVP